MTVQFHLEISVLKTKDKTRNGEPCRKFWGVSGKDSARTSGKGHMKTPTCHSNSAENFTSGLFFRQIDWFVCLLVCFPVYSA